MLHLLRNNGFYPQRLNPTCVVFLKCPTITCKFFIDQSVRSCFYIDPVLFYDSRAHLDLLQPIRRQACGQGIQAETTEAGLGARTGKADFGGGGVVKHESSHS